MSSDHENLSYLELSDSVAANTSQQVLHFGQTYKDLQEKALGKGESKTQVQTTYSPFAKDSRPVTFYYPYSKGVSGTSDEKKDIFGHKVLPDEFCVNYELNDVSHGLSGFSLALMLPQVKAMPGYKVRWCHNVASHYMRFGVFTHNKTKLHYFDEITADDNIMQLEAKGDIESLYRDLGNVPELQNFSDFLPQYECSPPIPFCFNEDDPNTMFPLYMCCHGDKVDVTFSFVRDPQSLLIIAKGTKNVNGEEVWSVIKPEAGKRYATFMENGNDVNKFSIPLGCAHYAYLSQDECNGNWCDAAASAVERKADSFFVNQGIPYASRNAAQGSDAVLIESIRSTYPVTCITWKAQLVGNKGRHVLSNYTSDPSPDFLSSISPITTSSINNGKTYLLKDVPGVITTKQNSRFHMRRSPKLPGINFRSFGIRLTDGQTKPGFYFNNGLIEVKLEERDYNVKNGVKKSYEENFTVEARVYARLEFRFTTFPKSDDERLTSEKSIILPVNGRK